MTDQLQWLKPDDWTLTSKCGRYTIKRELDYSDHPACRWKYLPKHVADGRAIAGTFHDSKLARAACEDDLQQQRQSAASGDDHGR